MAVEKLLWANEMGMAEGGAWSLEAGWHTRVGVC